MKVIDILRTNKYQDNAKKMGDICQPASGDEDGQDRTIRAGCEGIDLKPAAGKARLYCENSCTKACSARTPTSRPSPRPAPVHQQDEVDWAMGAAEGARKQSRDRKERT